MSALLSNTGPPASSPAGPQASSPASPRRRDAAGPAAGTAAVLLLVALSIAAQYKPAQTQSAADEKSRGCLTCHKNIEPMHTSPAVRLGCTDCHGGNAAATTKDAAHVKPLHPEIWKTSANPPRSYTALLQESPEFVKFANPGDLRVAEETCGGCHQKEVNAVPRSTMTTSSVFWAAAAYANGILPTKKAILGESYGRDGAPRAVKPATPPTPQQIARGALAMLLPLPRWEIMQPGEYFRAFERGGIAQGSAPPDIGNPLGGEEAGRPDIRLGNRGRGTGLRISPGLINIHKTRLNDPHLSFLGTNDHPGDYRSSGCTACHVVYANDRDELHSGPYAAFGNDGKSQTADPTIPRSEKGHPIRHQFTRAVPTSQCMSCHMHQPNSFVNTYLGYTMWDYETDASLMWPKQQKYPTEVEKRASLDANPEGAAARGLWSDPDFLEKVATLNEKAKNTQFADYHGHGWNFMAVYKRDRKGNLLDADGKIVSFDDPARFQKAVHLQDIHLEKGMHCADCHFSQDEHGNGQIYGEYANSIEIECVDCHGTVDHTTTLRTSGPAAPPGGTDLTLGTTPDGRRRFAWVDGHLFQRSMVNPGAEWEVLQTTANDAHSAKHLQTMTCYACHTSWMTSCSGCHLPQEANAKSEVHHFEGETTRNYASYNPQVIRTDAFMLGINGTTKGHKIAPVRSSSALVISSTNALRDRIYVQQPPISAAGYSSQAFNPHVPHTVRTRETQGCGSCHLTKENDNNAWMAQLLLQGTNFVNFIGRYAWVAEGPKGFDAVAVTEWDEPQAVIGSSLHSIVYPDYFAQHTAHKLELQTAHHHHGGARSIQLRGEYLFTANGEEGFEVYDVANVDNKDYSERITSAPVSPRGQRTFVRTKFATSVALPTTMPVAVRNPLPENEEQPMHPLYRYAYISDREEGLIIVDVSTLTDGNPSNNFLTRAATFNPDGALRDAETVTIAGRYAYVGCERGVVVVDIDQPLQPKIVATLSLPSSAASRHLLPASGEKGTRDAHGESPSPRLRGEGGRRPGEGPTSIAIQFRYAFVVNGDALHVIDITDPTHPALAAALTIQDARSVYVARTYAYVAAGAQGLVIVDIERPDKPRIDQVVTEGLRDVNDVKVASTNASVFAYVADAEGLKILQLTSPEWTPTYAGFSPRPSPRLIARRRTAGPALAISKGLDRDRAVDESGNQVSIFNRIGARPMTLPEMQRLYLRQGKVYTVP
jgi:hypothetical protein